MDTGGRPAACPRPGRRALSGRPARRVDVHRQHRPAGPRVPRQAEGAGRAHARPLGLRPPLLDRRRGPQRPRPAPHALHRGGAAPHGRRGCRPGLRLPRAAARAREPVVLRRVRRLHACRSGSSWPASPRRPTAACCSTSTTSTSAPSTTASTRRRTSTPCPADRVVQYHLAGHTNKGTHIIDTHTDHAVAEVWELYRALRPRGPARRDALRVGRGHPRLRGRARRGAEGPAPSARRQARRCARRRLTADRSPPPAALDAGRRSCTRAPSTRPSRRRPRAGRSGPPTSSA